MKSYMTLFGKRTPNLEGESSRYMNFSEFKNR